MGARLLHEWFLYTNCIAEASLKTFSSASTMFLEGRPVIRVYLISLFWECYRSMPLIQG